MVPPMLFRFVYVFRERGLCESTQNIPMVLRDIATYKKILSEKCHFLLLPVWMEVFPTVFEGLIFCVMFSLATLLLI